MNNLITIVDYGLGNLFNIKRAFDTIGVDSIISQNAEDILKSSHIVLPGVGAFQEGIENLKKLELIQPIKEFSDSGRFVLGICLGMQLLLSRSLEGGVHNGLNLIQGEVIPLIKTPNIKVPHIGWSKLLRTPSVRWDHSVLEEVQDNPFMYFLHSYQVQVKNSDHILSSTTYGDNTFCSTIQHGNIVGCQYHPELSAKYGLLILKKFSTLT
jgi:imidazole glycerol-phosphate synthase subunit HisH